LALPENSGNLRSSCPLSRLAVTFCRVLSKSPLGLLIVKESLQETIMQGNLQVPEKTWQGLKPHRGEGIVVLGIIGLICCFICGIIAWVMANNDLREMAAGIMDPRGRGLTQAGKICGIISVIPAILILCLLVVALIGGVFAACLA